LAFLFNTYQSRQYRLDSDTTSLSLRVVAVSDLTTLM
jgi:hypothetical protein